MALGEAEVSAFFLLSTPFIMALKGDRPEALLKTGRTKATAMLQVAGRAMRGEAGMWSQPTHSPVPSSALHHSLAPLQGVSYPYYKTGPAPPPPDPNCS